jgi:hypothetical protein
VNNELFFRIPFRIASFFSCFIKFSSNLGNDDYCSMSIHEFGCELKFLELFPNHNHPNQGLVLNYNRLPINMRYFKVLMNFLI